MTEELESNLTELAEWWRDRADEIERKDYTIDGAGWTAQTLRNCACRVEKEVEKSQESKKMDTKLIDQFIERQMKP